MGPRAGLDGRKNLDPTGIRSRTVQSVALSLYRLSYRTRPRILVDPDLIPSRIKSSLVAIIFRPVMKLAQLHFYEVQIVI